MLVWRDLALYNAVLTSPSGRAFIPELHFIPKLNTFWLNFLLKLADVFFWINTSNTCLTLICKQLQRSQVNSPCTHGILGLERVHSSAFAFKQLLPHPSSHNPHQSLIAEGYFLSTNFFFLVFQTSIKSFPKDLIFQWIFFTTKSCFPDFKDQHYSVWCFFLPSYLPQQVNFLPICLKFLSTIMPLLPFNLTLSLFSLSYAWWSVKPFSSPNTVLAT